MKKKSNTTDPPGNTATWTPPQFQVSSWPPCSDGRVHGPPSKTTDESPLWLPALPTPETRALPNVKTASFSLVAPILGLGWGGELGGAQQF